MLDICIPIHVPNIGQTISAVEAFKERTDVPHRFIFVIDGGTEGDRAGFIRYLATEEIKRYLHINDRAIGFSSCMAEAFAASQNELLVIAPPHILIEDSKWFGKMQGPFLKDQGCMLVMVEHYRIQAEQISPYKVVASKVSLWSEFALLRRKSMLEVIPVDGGPEEYIKNYAIKAEALGGTIWSEPSIRYGYAEHTPHTHTSSKAPREEVGASEDRYRGRF